MTLLLMFIGSVWAAAPELDLAKALTRAHSVAEIERMQAGYSRLRVADIACRLELREHAAPVSCYEALALARPPPDRSLKAARLKHLDKLCARAADALRVERGPPAAFVSAACAKNLASAREIREYREGEDMDWSKY